MGNALFKNSACSFHGCTSYSEVGSLSCFSGECATFQSQMSLRLAFGFVIFMFVTRLYLFFFFFLVAIPQEYPWHLHIKERTSLYNFLGEIEH